MKRLVKMPGKECFRSADWLESCFFVFPFKKSRKGKNEARKEVSTLWFKSEQQVHPKDKVDDRVLKAKRRTFGWGGGGCGGRRFLVR